MPLPEENMNLIMASEGAVTLFLVILVGSNRIRLKKWLKCRIGQTPEPDLEKEILISTASVSLR